MRLLRLWFGLTEPVTRSVYSASGFGLMTFKYLVEALVIHAVTGNWLLPQHYLNPLLSSRQHLVRNADWLLPLLVVWTLPFLWVGVSMTLRRAVDAGKSPFLSLLYFVPIVNYLLMIALCLLPSRLPGHPLLETKAAPSLDARFTSAMLGIVLGTAIAIAMVGLSVAVFGVYGTTLFFVTPVVMGAVSAFVFNQGHPRTIGATLLVAVITVVMAGGSLLLFALEGVLCLAMAAPLALIMAIMGAALGRTIALLGAPGAVHFTGIVALLPLLAGSEAVPATPHVNEVVTVIEIDAPPERVWEHVVGFTDLPEPSAPIFNLGIAYPRRARILGRGVGAVRYCEFSTGPFVEPITVWDQPSRLAFDVTGQPPVLHEWSPYRHVSPPHLEGYLSSRRGEFRLQRLPGNRTRLEGSTWYELRMSPEAYWNVYADALIHAIHRRVLTHVKVLSESKQ
jgi:uncharacterized membrane protein YhaH (DUF805 family)